MQKINIFCLTFSLTFFVSVYSQETFKKMNVPAGISATHSAIDEYYATGQAWGDYNRDGWLDIYLTNANGTNILYKNNGDGTFAVPQISRSVELTDHHSGGAVFADYNNDGWQDLYVLNWGENILFRNEQGAGFTDVTAAAGVGDTGKGETAAWGDYDGDGYLDLYVANWLCQGCQGSNDFSSNRDRLYHNNGNGTFTDVTDYLEFDNTDGAGFVGCFVDYDNDGDLDIYLVNDKFTNAIGNKLWRNDGPGCDGWCFTEVSKSAGANVVLYGMGLAIGDYDNDLDLDFYFSNMGQPVLLENQTSQGSPTFTDVTSEAGINNEGVTWGTFFFDYDNDGWLDLFQANGNIWSSLESPNFLYRNQGNGTFEDVSIATGLNYPGGSLGAAYADHNKDGRLDLIIGNWNEGYILYQNYGSSEPENNWLTLKLIGGDGVNHDAIGSRIYVSLNNGQTLMQEVKCGSSHGSGNQLALHFGLGKETISSVEVVWPNGIATKLGSIAKNQIFEITYPGTITTVTNYLNESLPDEFMVEQNYPNPFNPTTEIRYSVVKRARVEISVYNLLGQKVAGLIDATQERGTYLLQWDGADDSKKNVSSGIYILQVRAGAFMATRKMLFVQ